MIPSKWIIVGLIVDLIAIALRIGDEFGFTKPRSPSEQGMPIGPIFYLLGFVDLFFFDKKPFVFCITVLLCCLSFYIFIIFLPPLICYFILFIRRIKARQKRIFYSNVAEGISSQDAVEHALKYLVGNDNLEKGNTGFVYFNSTNHKFGGAMINLLASKKSLIYIVECDPGEIRGCDFTYHMSSFGFKMENWKIGRRKEIIVPPEDFGRIPQFIDALFRKYYGRGDNYQIKAEALKMS